MRFGSLSSGALHGCSASTAHRLINDDIKGVEEQRTGEMIMDSTAGPSMGMELIANFRAPD